MLATEEVNKNPIKHAIVSDFAVLFSWHMCMCLPFSSERVCYEGRTRKQSRVIQGADVGQPQKVRMTWTWNVLKEQMLERTRSTVWTQTTPRWRGRGSGPETLLRKSVAQLKTEVLQRQSFLRSACQSPVPVSHLRWTSPTWLHHDIQPTSKKTVGQWPYKEQRTPLVSHTPQHLLPSNRPPLLFPPLLFLLSAKCQVWFLVLMHPKPRHPRNRTVRKPPSRPFQKQPHLFPQALSLFLGLMTAAPVWHFLLRWALVLKHLPGEARRRLDINLLPMLALIICHTHGFVSVTSIVK